MVVFVEGENHEQVGCKKFIGGKMRNGTAMSYRKKTKQNEKDTKMKARNT
jgi:hypothetical protein